MTIQHLPAEAVGPVIPVVDKAVHANHILAIVIILTVATKPSAFHVHTVPMAPVAYPFDTNKLVASVTFRCVCSLLINALLTQNPAPLVTFGEFIA
jgi:hypothetical protein